MLMKLVAIHYPSITQGERYENTQNILGILVNHECDGREYNNGRRGSQRT